jgi:hypothetical protein
MIMGDSSWAWLREFLEAGGLTIEREREGFIMNYGP